MKNKISIESVKYGKMPEKQWYVSPNHSDWYYHSPRKYPLEEMNLKFLEATLDAPLRLLALGINSLGYTTLPSCSGHYKSKEELDEAYSNLIKDAKMIKKDGLVLADTETGEEFLLKDNTWMIPWDRNEFYKVANGGEEKIEGYLGFIVPKKDGYKVGSAIDLAVKANKGCRYEVKRKPNAYVFELRVHTGKQKSQDRAWENLGDDVMFNLIKAFQH